MADKIYGLLGRKLGHSFSVPIHKEMGNNDYRLIELELEVLSGFFLREDIGGLNVTIPYKREVMKYCDVLSPEAQEIGSVNTIVRRTDGKLYGYNTDAYGFEFVVRLSGVNFKNKKTLILGSGGASLAVQSVIRKLGASEVVVISRNSESNYNNLDRHSDANIVVNATPVGMYPETGKSPVDMRLFHKCEGAFDLIFNPLRTAFLMQAKELGIPSIGGLSMLVAQAKAAEELFFDVSIDDSEIMRIYEKLCRDIENVVLIGMPGCGKSAVAAALSDLIGRDLVDVDAEIEKSTGLTISDIFEKHGEAEFRRLEREAVAAFGQQNGKIISIGGGAVKDENNYLPLRQNGRIYYLERDLELLSREGRPLSANADLEKMFGERLPSYMRFKDATIKNDRGVTDTAKAIWEEFNEHTGD